MEDVEDALLPFASSASSFSLPFPTWETSQLDMEDEFSTGYLEDVLFQFRPPSKRRRPLMFAADKDRVVKNWSGATCPGNIFCQELNARVSEENASAEEATNSSSSSQNLVLAENQWTPEKAKVEDMVETEPPLSSPSGSNEDQKVKKTRVVYPFTVVKQGGFEGAATINDINRRILMTPTKPLRHPVGEFACRPLVLPNGPGLSGKAVVSFRRIQTPGRGTITIIRTRD